MANPHHEHYEHYDQAMIDRLDGFYGTVDDFINNEIFSEAIGPRVLDVGCGFGSLVDYFRVQGVQAVGIDMLEFCVKAGQKRYPQADLRYVASEMLPFPDQSFDTVVLKETLHHIHGESDSKFFFEEVVRICKRRVIIFDPNPTWVLLLARRIIGHVDPVCSHREAREIVERAGFQVVKTKFSNVVALPLSGGYVGWELVPRLRFLYFPILVAEKFLAFLINICGLSSHFSWRYLVVADREVTVKEKS